MSFAQYFSCYCHISLNKYTYHIENIGHIALFSVMTYNEIVHRYAKHTNKLQNHLQIIVIHVPEKICLPNCTSIIYGISYKGIYGECA